MHTNPRGRHRSYFFPIVLIFIGAVFLLINLGIAPAAEIKALFALWWPLILLAVGVWMLVQRRRDRPPN